MKPSPAKHVGLTAVAKTVLWSFLGIRKRSDHDADAVTLTPAQVVVAAVVGGALFVFILITVVRVVIASHGSTI